MNIFTWMLTGLRRTSGSKSLAMSASIVRLVTSGKVSAIDDANESVSDDDDYVRRSVLTSLPNSTPYELLCFACRRSVELRVHWRPICEVGIHQQPIGPATQLAT